MGKVLDRIRYGVGVFCKDHLIGKVNCTIRDPDWKKTAFFTVTVADKEILLPIEAIYEVKDGRIYLNATLQEIENLPDVADRDLCNSSGYIFPDLKAVIYETLDLARPFLDYY